MFKLVKWMAIGTVTCGVAGYAVFGTNFGSYVNTAAGSLREKLTDQVPIEFQLERADGLIQEIDPQLFNARRDVAQSEVDLANLQADVEHLEVRVEHGERKLRKAGGDVTASVESDSTGKFELTSYRRSRSAIELERSFDAFRSNVKILDAKRAQIERQTQTVAAARTHLDAVLAEKARLEDMIARLKTQKRQLDALAASSRGIELDDTALGKAREVLNDVKNRLDVTQRMLQDDIYFGDSEGATASHRDVSKEIQDYFTAVDRGAVGEEAYIEVR